MLSVPVEKDTSERVVLTGITQPGVTSRGRRSRSANYLQAVFSPQVKSRGILDGDLTPPLNVDMMELFVIQPENLENQQ